MCIHDELISRCMQSWGAQWSEVEAARSLGGRALQAPDLEACLRDQHGLTVTDKATFDSYTRALVPRAFRATRDADVVESVIHDALLKTHRRFVRAQAGESRHVVPRGPSSLPFLPYVAHALASAIIDAWWVPALAPYRVLREARAALREAQEKLDAFVQRWLLQRSLGAARAVGLKRLALCLTHRGLFHEDIAALLAQSPWFMANLIRRQDKLVQEGLERDAAFREMERQVELAEHDVDEAKTRISPRREELKKFRAVLRRRRDLRRRRGLSLEEQSEMERLQAEYAEWLRILGLEDPRQLPEDLDPAAEAEEGNEDWEQDDDEPAAPSED